MSDLVRRKISLFSLEALIDMATLGGLEPHVDQETEVAMEAAR